MSPIGNHPHAWTAESGPTSSPSTDQGRRYARRLGAEHGFTMIVTLGVLLVSSLLMGAAFVAAEGDIHLTQNDTAAKKAYYAAQAGIADYEYHLTQDGNYLNYCTAPFPANPALNQVNNEETKKPWKASELKTAEVPPGPKGEPSGERYAIQLLPSESSKAEGCDKNNVVGTMLEQKAGGAAGTFRIASTGFAEGKRRTIVATFKNLNFVSYVWYSVYETGDSSLYGKGGPKCGFFYKEPPRALCKRFDNFFITGESVNGPMHTEDHAGICGSPSFGRSKNDRIEFGNGINREKGVEGYDNEGRCEKANPKMEGKLIPPNETLSIKPPPGDEELEHIVEPEYKYCGKTEIELTGENMKVTGLICGQEKAETKVRPFPPTGVIYVAGSCEPYSPFGPVPSYTTDSTCGNVYVHGNYKQALTIAAQNDVVINGNITTPGYNEGEGKPTTNAMLGLIANNFVRVYHPLTAKREQKFLEGKCPTTKNDEVNDLKKPTIYAAILALKHAFIVDNFDCGEPNLGTLNVYGAIAGLFTNGMTGVFSGVKTVLSGYGYNLTYDNRLQVAEPPHFLNPIQAAWIIQRETLAPTP